MSKELKRPKEDDFWMEDRMTNENGCKSIPLNHHDYEVELNMYIDKLESKLKEAEEKNKTFVGKARDLIMARFDLGIANAKLEAVKDSLMNDEITFDEQEMKTEQFYYNSGIKLQRDRTLKALSDV